MNRNVVMVGTLSTVMACLVFFHVHGSHGSTNISPDMEGLYEFEEISVTRYRPTGDTYTSTIAPPRKRGKLVISSTAVGYFYNSSMEDLGEPGAALKTPLKLDSTTRRYALYGETGTYSFDPPRLIFSSDKQFNTSSISVWNKVN